jgi:2'-5' RNA ligase
MTEAAIEANHWLVEEFDSPIVLGRERYRPHISLAMGCIDERDLPDIEAVLCQIANETTLPRLEVSGLETSESFSGNKVSVLAIERKEELQKLHEDVTAGLRSYLGHEAAEEMVWGDKASGSTLAWIKNYAQNSSYENFRPHITIGYGQLIRPKYPLEFGANTLALCHLADHCTCRAILATFSICGL